MRAHQLSAARVESSARSSNGINTSRNRWPQNRAECCSSIRRSKCSSSIRYYLHETLREGFPVYFIITNVSKRKKATHLHTECVCGWQRNTVFAVGRNLTFGPILPMTSARTLSLGRKSARGRPRSFGGPRPRRALLSCAFDRVTMRRETIAVA